MSISVAIIIPVYRESSYIEKTLRSIEKSVQFSLEKNWIPHVILVVNNPIAVSDAFRKENKQLIQNITDLRSELTYPVDILDYTEPGLNNGVGEARKIGMAFALTKYLKNPNDLIVSLDADCTVDLNYIATLFGIDFKGSAFTLYFEHALDSNAIVYYELYLRYLRWGIFLAKSPFGYYSVGSSLGTTVKFYEKSGGMVAKSATEDFHFLNKMRKHGSIAYLTETSVHPSSRLSQRVTLGTGYFLTEAKVGFEKAFAKLMLPSPNEFEKLGKIWEIIRTYDGKTPLSTRFEELNLVPEYKDLHQRGIIQKIHNIFETTTNPTTYQERLLEVMDGLETLRILRIMWTSRKPIDETSFIQWCGQLWNVTEKDPKILLQLVRDAEKATASLDV